MEKDKTQNLPSSLGDVTSHLSNKQIELIATIFSKGNEYELSDMEVEWLLGHAFQLGAKFYRDFITNCQSIT
jgi:hypothetical protein